MSTSTPPNLPVSGAFDPDIDELTLSQFCVVNVDEFKHPVTFDNEDIYSLAVDFGDMGDNFSNLTQQYALMVQAPVVGAEPNLVQEEETPIDSPPKDTKAPTVRNPSR